MSLYAAHGDNHVAWEHDVDEYGTLFEDLEGVDGNQMERNDEPTDKERLMHEELTRYWSCAGIPRVKKVDSFDGNVPVVRYIVQNPLEWWKTHEAQFPLVAKLARRMLLIPASSAPSERLFSDAGITIAKDRANLLPDVAASVIFLQDAWEMAENYLRDNV